MKRLLIVVMLLMCLSYNAKAQFTFKNLEELKRVKSGTTYVLMNNTDSLNCEAYIEIFKKYWTLTKIEFITDSQLESVLSPQNSFLSILEIETIIQTAGTDPQTGYMHPSAPDITINVYLSLWTCDRSYLERGKTNFNDKYKKEIVHVELIKNPESTIKIKKHFATDCINKDYYKNFGPGMLKNYLQQLMVSLNPDTTITSDNTASKKTIKDLRNEPLYAPDYVLMKYGLFGGVKRSERDVFNQYKYKYQLLPLKDIDNKILKDTIPFFYLTSFSTRAGRYVSVTNSQTGEMVYGDLEQTPGNLKDDDLKYIYKRVAP